MVKHHVGDVDDAKFYEPQQYNGHAQGYRRLDLITDATCGASVHMGAYVVEIAPGGGHEPVVNAFEKGFYILSGEAVLQCHGRAHLLREGHYGVIQKGVEYTLHNPGKAPLRLFDMNAPQPKPADHNFKDIIFQPGKIATSADPVDLDDPRVKFLGYYPNREITDTATSISAVGVRSNSIDGIVVKELIDRMLGAHHLALFLVQFSPGGMGTSHDHPLEEIYFFLSGKAEAILDGRKYQVSAGQYVWTGVGCFHSFECVGDEPVRWIETQAPLPTDFETFRFRREWDPLSA
jgi:mannose-6-phosphate isomerase-like protein (cupin superfamily)